MFHVQWHIWGSHPFCPAYKPNVIFCEQHNDLDSENGRVRTRVCLVTQHYYAKSSLRRVIRVVVRYCFAAGVRSPDNDAIFDSENHCNPPCAITQVPWIRGGLSLILLNGWMYHHPRCYISPTYSSRIKRKRERYVLYNLHNLTLYRLYGSH